MLKLFSSLVLATFLLFTGIQLFYHSEIMSSALTIDLFVMSKCPDGVFAQSTFYDIQNHPDLQVPLTVNLAFITNDKNECMHGPSECEGNKMELAVQAHLGGQAGHGILNFTRAYDRDYPSIGSSEAYLADSFRMANVTADEESAIRKIYADDGETLLKQSAAYAKDKKARYSATIMMHGRSEVLAIRDSGTWKNLVDGLGNGTVEDWVKYLNGLTHGL